MGNVGLRGRVRAPGRDLRGDLRRCRGRLRGPAGLAIIQATGGRAMKMQDAAMAARLVEALAELPRVRRGLHAKSRLYDGFVLEIQAAEISDGVTQGAAH